MFVSLIVRQNFLRRDLAAEISQRCRTTATATTARETNKLVY